MRLGTDGIKAMSRGFSGSMLIVYLDNRKWTTFYIKEDNDNFIWVEVTIVTFFNAVENDVNVVETQTVHFAWLLNRRFVLRV